MSLVVIGCHWLSLVVIGCDWLSLVFNRAKIEFFIGRNLKSTGEISPDSSLISCREYIMVAQDVSPGMISGDFSEIVPAARQEENIYMERKSVHFRIPLGCLIVLHLFCRSYGTLNRD